MLTVRPRLSGINRYLQERRLGAEQNNKRAVEEVMLDGTPATSAKRPRGRPKGSKNRGSKVPGGGGPAPEAIPV